MSTLKELTSEKHKEAEEQPFIKSIFKGQVDRTKYIDYLYQLLVLYQSLEWHGTRLGVFKGIENIK
jgi:heme oxygenase